MKRCPKNHSPAFTLVEVLVAIAVLALLIALIGQLFSNTSTASSLSATHMEADARVRLLFGRMAADFSHIAKRTDIDYYLKSPAHQLWAYSSTQSPANLQAGNDQMAFYSEVPGYAPATSTDPQNAVSLVAYRINNYSTTAGPLPCLERLGTALTWGDSSTSILPVAYLTTGGGLSGTIATTWPTATLTPTSNTTSDPAYDVNYETIVPNAFRFEYYYLLHSGALSATPWDTAQGHTMISGLQDVAGIGIVIAVTDRKASAIATTTQLTNLAASLVDFGDSHLPTPIKVGTLQTYWQNTVTANSLGLPSAIVNGVRVYEQVFCLDTPSQ